MALKVLDTVVLLNDSASHKVRAGDIGTVVEVYQPDGLEVEFISGTGKTVALLTVKMTDVRAVRLLASLKAWAIEIKTA